MLSLAFALFALFISPPKVAVNDTHSVEKLVLLSQDYALAAKSGTSVDSLEQLLAAWPKATFEQLEMQQQARKCIWLNLYNARAASQTRILGKDYANPKARGRMFREKSFVVGGQNISLNKIEHGILRHKKIWWSMGYLPALFESRFVRNQTLPLDYRIHFALNCGAKSCPPFAYYELATLDEQLSTATKGFLQTNSKFEGETLYISKLFSWYRRDFHSQGGPVALHKQMGAIAQDAEVHTVKYLPYDWTSLYE